MPQGLTTPNWYNDDTYIKDKVAECNVIRFGDAEQLPWTPESVRSFLAAANGEEDYQPWMGYDNFVSNGNAENCSPNPLFNVMEYLTAKANQLNAMNDGAGYESNNSWTAESVLRYFNDHHLSAWDHFTTAGQFENVNPSNAMDLSDFLANKAAQCNSMEFDGKSDWTPESVLAYYQENGINAVQVAVSASDPNVVAVPAAEAVAVPAGETPWGAIQLTPVNLEVGQDTVTDGGMPTNFIGTVETSNAKSSFNADDQITGTNPSDVLTVAMNSDFSNGMGKDGFVKGVPTVALTSNVHTSNLTFNATGLQGVETWNLNGDINLTNQDATGATVNLSNAHSTTGITLGFAAGVNSGPEDALTLGVNEVYVPGAASHQPENPVNIAADGIEVLTVNSTGAHENIIGLNGVGNMNALTVNGGANLRVAEVNTLLKTIDGEDATGSLNINATKADQIQGATLGQGNDTLTVQNILPSATIEGGDGNDRLVMSNNAGTYNFNMDGVENMTIQQNTGDITLNGADVDGLASLRLQNTSVVAPDQVDTRVKNIHMENFEDNDLLVEAYGSNNTTNFTNETISNVNIRVGDGDRTTTDSWVNSQITLGSASNLNIDATDATDKQATFNNQVDAASVTTLGLNAGTQSKLTVARDSDLRSVSHINASGTGDIVIDANSAVGIDSTQVNVNTMSMASGSFTATFTDNEAHGQNSILEVKGTTMADNNITVDSSYSKVEMNTGMGNDKLIITGTDTDTAPTVVANLGGGANMVIVDTIKNVDLSNLTGSGQVVTVRGGSVLNADVPAGWTLVDSAQFDVVADSANPDVTQNGTPYDDTFKLAVSGNAKNVTVNGEGDTDTYQGNVDSLTAEVSLNGGEGAINTVFANAATNDVQDDLELINVQELTVTGGALANNIAGNVGNVIGDFTLTDAANTFGGDVINLASVSAGGTVSVTGATGVANVYNVKVEKGNGITLDSGSAQANGVDASGKPSGDGASASVVAAAAGDVQGDITITTGAGNDQITLGNIGTSTAEAQRTLTINAGAGEDTLNTTGTVDLTNWTVNGNATQIENLSNTGQLDMAGLQLWNGLKVTQTAGSLTADVAANASVDLSGASDGTTNLTLNNGAKVTLGGAADHIILGATDGAPTEDANIVVNGFASASDKIVLDGYLDGFGAASAAVASLADAKAEVASTAMSASGGTAPKILADDNIYAFSGTNVADLDASGIADLFGTVSAATQATRAETGSDSTVIDINDLYLADGENAVLALAGTGTSTNLWYVSNGENAGTDDLSVTLIGTINGLAVADVAAGIFEAPTA